MDSNFLMSDINDQWLLIPVILMLMVCGGVGGVCVCLCVCVGFFHYTIAFNDGNIFITCGIYFLFYFIFIVVSLIRWEFSFLYPLWDLASGQVLFKFYVVLWDLA